MKAPQRILVLRPSAVGDFIFALPALHAMKTAWPDSRITYIGRAWHADFLRERASPVDEVLVLPPCPGVGLPSDAQVDSAPLEDFLAGLQARQPDLALQVFGGGQYSNPLVKRFGAAHSAGLKADHAEPLDTWVHYGPLQNRRLQLLELASRLGACTWKAGPELQAKAQERGQARELLEADSSHPLAVIQPGASDCRRRWPAARFAFIADCLCQRGWRVAVNGTESESAVVQEVLRHMRHPAQDLSGRLPLSLLCGVLAQAQLVVSNDTGPLHLALALGTPAVGIYWLSNLMESGPLLQHHHRPLMSVRLDCPVCGMQNLKQRCPHDVCFVDDVEQEAVLEEVLALTA